MGDTGGLGFWKVHKGVVCSVSLSLFFFYKRLWSCSPGGLSLQTLSNLYRTIERDASLLQCKVKASGRSSSCLKSTAALHALQLSFGLSLQPFSPSVHLRVDHLGGERDEEVSSKSGKLRRKKGEKVVERKREKQQKQRDRERFITV